MATLSFDGLQKSYGEVKVLHRVDLEVDDGEYLILVGPSGCGKSTLLRCIAGLEEISGGELRIGGERVNERAPKERDVAMVFQSYALYPHMTVRQNIGFPLRIARRPTAEIDAAVAEVSAMLGLDELLDRTPGQLSGGQRQRVAMGRAIVRRPSVFLFDEPLSNLDASLRHQMRVELKKLHRTLGATIVHVTHDQVEALTLADRILVLDAGVVQQAGTPRELFDTPANTFVAQFIGSPSMNLLPVEAGRVTGTDQAVSGGPATHSLGVRPTDLTLVSADTDGALATTVDVVESLGAEALVHCHLGDHSLVATVREPTELGPGDEAHWELGVVHRFDSATGERLAG